MKFDIKAALDQAYRMSIQREVRERILGRFGKRRCAAITNRRKPCVRYALNSRFCWQHNPRKGKS